MDIHNSIMAIHNLIMDIHDWIMDIHNYRVYKCAFGFPYMSTEQLTGAIVWIRT